MNILESTPWFGDPGLQISAVLLEEDDKRFTVQVEMLDSSSDEILVLTQWHFEPDRLIDAYDKFSELEEDENRMWFYY